MSDRSFSPNLLWASTGGGWRAMFADAGYANAFAQAGLLTPSTSRIASVSTVSGGSWFSAQLFYSGAFYNRTAMAATPGDVRDFVVRWMGAYYNISTDVDESTEQVCDFSDLSTDSPDQEEKVTLMTEWCEVLVQYDYDWALFIRAMLEAAADEYGTPGFVDVPAVPRNVIPPLRSTDLLIQASLSPTSRIRGEGSGGGGGTAVYLGHVIDGNTKEEETSRLLTPAISAAWIVDTQTQTARFQYGTDDLMAGPTIQTFTAPTPDEHSWETWQPFFLYQGNGTTFGDVRIDNTDAINASYRGTLRTPFGSFNNGSSNNTSSPTVLQVAAASSAAAASASPLAPSAYTQTLSIGYYVIDEYAVDTVWRVLAGVASGIGAGLLLGWAVAYAGHRRKWCRRCTKSDATTAAIGADDNNGTENSTTNHGEEEGSHCCKRPCCQCEKPARNWGIGCGVFGGILVGLLTGLLYGAGSIVVPKVYDNGVNKVYTNNSFDNFAVCSQWPNLPCGEEDAYMMDGWYVDNPALPINVAHIQQRIARNETIKVLLTNCDQVWDDEWTQAQYLAYYSTYFNQDIAPGEFLWGPGWYMPSRSQQIFQEYLDPAGLNALLEPIPDSNMTTARLSGTTVYNPSFQVQAGQRVEMLLLNLNANITTYVIGSSVIANLTEPLAEMASHIAGSEELVRRVRDFATMQN